MSLWTLLRDAVLLAPRSFLALHTDIRGRGPDPCRLRFVSSHGRIGGLHVEYRDFMLCLHRRQLDESGLRIKGRSRRCAERNVARHLKRGR